jgi:hypothetical protein
MDVIEELRKLEERRKNYLSIVLDPGRKRLDREVAQVDMEQVETKIAELRRNLSKEKDEDHFDTGGES